MKKITSVEVVAGRERMIREFHFDSPEGKETLTYLYLPLEFEEAKKLGLNVVTGLSIRISFLDRERGTK